MKKLFNYKHTLKYFLVLMVMLSAYSSNATHLSGGDISYKCIGLRKWEITLVVYRDCSGVQMPSCNSGSQTSCTKTLTARAMATIANGGLNPNGCTAPVQSISVTVTSFKVESIMKEARGVCGTSAKNTCTNNATTSAGTYTPAIEGYYYRGVLDMSSTIYDAANVCSYWEVEWNEASRSVNINNISNSGGTNYFISAVINIHHNQNSVNWANSSPEFKNEAVMIICSNRETFKNVGAADPDRDSLTYKIAKSKGTGGVPVNYAAPYSENKPFPLNGGSPPHTLYPQPNGPYVILDSLNGDISFNATNSHPTNIIWGQLNVEVTQWNYNANGTPFIVGRTQRELQMYVRSCPANISPRFATSPSLPNNSPKFNWTVCAGEQLCFTVTAKDDDDGPEPGPSTKQDTTYVSWNNAIERPGKLTFAKDYDTTIPAQRPREDRWKFCWQTEASDGSRLPYYFTVTGMDNHCPNVGQVTRAFSVTVIPVAALANSLYDDSCGRYRYEVKKLDLKQTLTLARLDIAKEPNDFTFASGMHTTISSNLNPTSVASPIILADTVALKRPGKYLVRYVALTTGSCPETIVYDTITVVVGYPQLALTTQLDTVCKNVATLTLAKSPLGGVLSGTAIDSNGVINIQSASILANNFYVYKYKYVDSTSCVDSVTKTVFVMPNTPVIISSQKDSVCKNALTFGLTATPTKGIFSGKAINSNTGNINLNDTALLPNTAYQYKYVYSNNYGCLDSNTKTIFVNPVPEATLTSTKDSVCKSLTNFFVTGSPANGVYSGLAINSANGHIVLTSAAIVANVAYNYNYIYTSNAGCVDTASKTIFVLPTPVATLTSSTDTVCKNVSAHTLSATPANGTFLGTAISNTGIINFQQSGILPNTLYTYKYYVANNGGCADTATKNIYVKPNVQTTLTSSTDTVCKNVIGFKLTGTPASGVFSGTSINSSGTINLQHSTITPNTTFTYKYKYSNAFGCADSSLKNIRILPNVVTSLLSIRDTACQNATAFTLTGIPANGVYYGNGINSSGVINLRSTAIIPNAKQPYKYVVSNSYGCADSSTKNIFVSAMPPVTLTANKDTVCKNDNFFTLTASPFNGVYSGTSINAISGEIDLRLPVIQTNQWYQYKYTYANALGCKDSAFKGIYVLVNPQASVIAGNLNPQKNTSVSYAVDLVNNLNYVWQVNAKGAIQSSNKNTATILWNDTGSTTISVTASNSCGLVLNTYSVTISPASGINENSWLNDFTLFPNPATNQITVSFYAKQTDMNLQVFNSTLQLVKTVPLSSVNNQYNTTVSLDNLSAGLYFVKVGNSQYQHTTKVIVNK